MKLYALTIVKELPRFRRIVVPSSSGSLLHSSRTAWP